MNIDTGTIITAFLLTFFAGLSTSIGSALAFFTKKTNTKMLSIALGFSAGVMIYIAFIEIFQKAKDTLILQYGATNGYWFTVLAFFGGILLMAIIDKLVPSYQNPHEIRNVEEMQKIKTNGPLLRMGLFSALAITIHNFPEGLATFTAAINDFTLGLSIAIAIAIHNIPEGIAISVPIFHATGSKKKAFLYSSLSGMAEPIGALVGILLLATTLSQVMLGFLFALVAGIMIYISLDELLPAAQKYGEHHLSILGLMSGMALMAFSLLLFA
jgi:zinc transporter, ZIP family